MTEKNLSHFGQNVWKYRLKNTCRVFWNNCETKWPKCLSKKTNPGTNWAPLPREVSTQGGVFEVSWVQCFSLGAGVACQIALDEESEACWEETWFFFTRNWWSAKDFTAQEVCAVGARQSAHGVTLQSTGVSVCFRGNSRLPSAFVFLRWFKLAHISIQVCTFHDGCKQGIDQQIFHRKSKDWGRVILREIDFL